MLFAFTKLKKLALKGLQCAMSDFYPLTEIIAAEERLQLDAEKLPLEGIPYLPKRRGIENRTVKEVDDIFTLINFLDERKSFAYLPRYVYDDTDHVPSSRLSDADMSFLLCKLEKLEKLEKLDIIEYNVLAIQDQFKTLKVDLLKFVSQSSHAGRHVDIRRDGCRQTD